MHRTTRPHDSYVSMNHKLQVVVGVVHYCCVAQYRATRFDVFTAERGIQTYLHLFQELPGSEHRSSGVPTVVKEPYRTHINSYA